MSVQQSRVQGICNGIRIYTSYIKPYLSAIEWASRKNCTNCQNIAEESQRSAQSATGLPQHRNSGYRTIASANILRTKIEDITTEYRTAT